MGATPRVSALGDINPSNATVTNHFYLASRFILYLTFYYSILFHYKRIV